MYAPFPESVLREIRHYPGNQKCCDCSSLDTDWGNVNHGTLICLDCAGKHRALGVHVSFIRSLYMDTWSENQVAMMKYGGNGQIHDYFKKLNLENSSIEVLYLTKGVALYREKLKERVEKILSGEITVEIARPFTSHPSMDFSHDKTTPQISTDKAIYHEAIFDTGPMGITLTKDYKGRAMVSKIVPGGAGALKGVQINDNVIGIMGKAISEYDEVMHMILCMERPIRLTFSRIIKPISPKNDSNDIQKVSNHKAIPNHTSSSSSSFVQSLSSSKSDPGLSSRLISSVDSVNRTNPQKKPIKPISRAAYSHDDSSDDSDVDISINKTLEKAKLKRSKQQAAASSDRPQTGSMSTSQTTLPRNTDSQRDPDSKSDNVNNPSAPKVEEILPTSKESETINDNEATLNDNNPTTPIQHSLVDSETKDDAIVNDGAKDDNVTDENQMEDTHLSRTVAEETPGNEECNVSPPNITEDTKKDDSIEEGDGQNEEEDDEDDVEEDDEEEEDENDLSEDEPLSAYLQVGMEVMAFRKNKWRMAIIKKIHKDGSFKVYFVKEKSTESHVSVDRIGLTPQTLQDIEKIMQLKKTSSLMTNASTDETTAEPEFYSNMSAAADSSFRDDEEFVVPTSDSLDDWIEDDTNLINEIKAALGSKEEYNDAISDIPTLPIESSKQYIAKFPFPPLGLTLGRGNNYRAEVLKVKSDGQASRLGVMVGDILVYINNYIVQGYDDAMPIISQAEYPLALTFERGTIHSLLHQTGDVVAKGSKILTSTIKETVGLNRKSIMDEPIPERLANRSKDRMAEASVTEKQNKMTTKRVLPDYPSSTLEYDIVFEDGDLGMRLEEKIINGGIASSIVTSVTDKSQAAIKRVQLDSYVVGVNGESYISHAHTIACLKHSKRPVKVRFCRRR